MECFQVIISGLSRSRCLSFDKTSIFGRDVFEKIQEIEGIPVQEQRLIYESKDLLYSTPISSVEKLLFLNFSLRLHGGKGGFGALLRGQGAKLGAKKTTNFDDCRDLSGRRIRHVNNEKKLQEWLEQQPVQAAQEPKKKKKKEAPQEKFNDAEFAQQTKEIVTSVESSVEIGLKKFLEDKNKGSKEEVSTEDDSGKKRKFLSEPDLFDELDFNGEEIKKSSIIETVAPLPKIELPKSLADIVGPILLLPTGLDLASFGTQKDLEALGADRIKSELQNIGLICGGKPEERATRLFSLKGKTFGEIDTKLFAKAAKKQKK